MKIQLPSIDLTEVYANDTYLNITQDDSSGNGHDSIVSIPLVMIPLFLKAIDEAVRHAGEDGDPS